MKCAKDLRIIQLEDCLRKLNEDVDLSSSNHYAYVRKLLKETPEESFQIYKEYMEAIRSKKYRNIFLIDHYGKYPPI
ncbi:MAG: hypothetical protein JHC33_02495 [Ignisphaera sp.]|nr:hypothetical protein [Ignisphaera sp.]